jgi:hypothetical protein
VPRPEPEIGSEFHWDPAALRSDAQGGGTAWPAGHELFATGSGALTALLRRLGRPRLHVPSFFCTGVAELLAADAPLAWYRHLPDERGPRLDSLTARPGDVVLAQNLFGRDDRAPWDAWIRDHPSVVVVEDHSHDPLSPWASTSTAAYAVASLRKTLPLPDGGLLWSPRGLPVPAPTGPAGDGADLKLTAMLLKAAWRDGRPVPKETFRALQQEGEHRLLGSAGPASATTRALLPLIDAASLRDRATERARALAAMLPATDPEWRVLPVGPAGTATFRVQLLCRTGEVRDALLGHLARHRIFAPVHWRQVRAGFWSGDEEAADRADRILTLPVDHRCTPDDVRRIAEVLRVFAAVTV